jgi:hypothetical protein
VGDLLNEAGFQAAVGGHTHVALFGWAGSALWLHIACHECGNEIITQDDWTLDPLDPELKPYIIRAAPAGSTLH